MGEITVVIPAYNAEATLPRTLESVRAQTLAPAEILVIDDGSRDRTAEIARSYGARVLVQRNAGVSTARNTGVREARTDWVAFLDADDLWEADKLERQWRAHEVCPYAGVICCDFSQFRGEGEVVVASFFASPLSRYHRLSPLRVADDIAYYPKFESRGAGMFFFPSAVMARRDVMLDAGLFDPTLHLAEDGEFFLRVLTRTPLVVVERPLMRYRLRERSWPKYNLEMTLSVIRITEKIVANPQAYPPGAAEGWGRSLPWKLGSAGRLLLISRRHREARALLARSLRLRWSFRTLAFWSLTWVSPESLDRLRSLRRWLQRGAAPIP
jgi:glycosyltransferase involved in cell wall biosynthesis